MIEAGDRQENYRRQNRGRLHHLPAGWNVDRSSFSPRQRRRLIKKYRRRGREAA